VFGGPPKAVRKALRPLGDLVLALATKLRPFEGPLLTTLERAIFEIRGERVGREAWDLRALPAYLDMSFRVVDERDKVLAHSRDLADLQRTLGHRAKELWATAPRERHERTGLKTFDLDALPASVTVDVGGRRLLAYPALVESETAVDVRLLESPQAAADATRAGLRKLFLIAMGTTLTKLEAQLPPSLALGPQAPTPGAVPPRRQVIQRALDDAFRLADPADLPRTKAAFTERLAAGKVAFPGQLGQLARIAVELGAEFEKVRLAVKALTGKPGAPRAVVDDLTAQFAHLAPPDLIRVMSTTRLGHILRYLKAVQVRLQRQAYDPPKDLQKAALVAPFWKNYQTRRAELLARNVPLAELREIEEFGWLVEELRVQTFAPELKTAVPISAQRLTDLWATLPR